MVWQRGKDVEGRGRGLIWGPIQASASRGWEKPRKSSVRRVSLARFEPGTSRIQVWSVTAVPACSVQTCLNETHTATLSLFRWCSGNQVTSLSTSRCIQWQCDTFVRSGPLLLRENEVCRVVSCRVVSCRTTSTDVPYSQAREISECLLL
jgi:hypothetical protein